MAKTKTDIWMPIYVGDYLGDTMHLTTEQHGAYFLLMLAYWKNRGPLPKNKVKAIVTIDDYSWTILEEFFDTTSSPGMWIHNRIEEELKKSLIRKQAAENRGKKGMEARWGDKKKDSSTIVGGIVGDSTSPSPSEKERYIVQHGDKKIPLKDGIMEVLDLLNEKREILAGKKLRAITSDKNIKARLLGGASVFECCRVVEVKAQHVKEGRLDIEYFHPSTLFGPENFKKYSDQAELAR